MKKQPSNIKLRTQIFLAVRDIPYKIGRVSDDASCVAKTKLLGELLSRIGLKCQVWKAQMRWDRIGIPTDLIRLAPRPCFSHLFLKVFIPETKSWVTLDPTWDQRFKGKFPLNTWDGLSNTALAYPSNQLELVGLVKDFAFRDFDPTEAFTNSLNAWYQSVAERKSC